MPNINKKCHQKLSYGLWQADYVGRRSEIVLKKKQQVLCISNENSHSTVNGWCKEMFFELSQMSIYVSFDISATHIFLHDYYKK